MDLGTKRAILPAKPEGYQYPSGWQVKKASHLHTQRFTVVSSLYLGVAYHPTKGGTVVHFDRDCICNEHAMELRWQGHLATLLHPTKQRCMFLFTPAAERYFSDALELSGGNLRGIVFEASRLKPRANGEVFIKIVGKDQRPEALPPEPDLLEVVGRILKTPLGSAVKISTPCRTESRSFTSPALNGNGRIVPLPGQQNLPIFEGNGVH